MLVPVCQVRKGDEKIMAKARFKFAYEDNYMTTQALENYVARATRDDMAALRSEYTRMRDVAQKRIKRLQASEFNQAKAVLERPEGFPKLKELRPEDIPYAMNELYRFLRAKTSTVSGQRTRMMKTIKTFAEAGIQISEKEYPTFIKVLESLRKQKLMYDSEHVKQVTEAMLSSNKVDKRLWTSRKRLKAIMEHASELELLRNKITAHRGKMTAVDMDDALKEIGWLE